jgi:hypothetical protein
VIRPTIRTEQGLLEQRKDISLRAPDGIHDHLSVQVGGFVLLDVEAEAVIWNVDDAPTKVTCGEGLCGRRSYRGRSGVAASAAQDQTAYDPSETVQSFPRER